MRTAGIYWLVGWPYQYSKKYVVWLLSKRASYQFHQFHPKPFLSVFTHLATSLVFDLGLNNPVQVTPSTFNLHQCPRPSTLRTMEERRAALGCYLMTSMYVEYTPRMIWIVIDLSEQNIFISSKDWSISMDTTFGWIPSNYRRTKAMRQRWDLSPTSSNASHSWEK